MSIFNYIVEYFSIYYYVYENGQSLFQNNGFEYLYFDIQLIILIDKII